MSTAHTIDVDTPTADAGMAALLVLVATIMVAGPIGLMIHQSYLSFTATQAVGSVDPFGHSGWFPAGPALLLALVPVLVGFGTHRRSKPLIVTALVLASIVVLGYVLAMGMCG